MTANADLPSTIPVTGRDRVGLEARKVAASLLERIIDNQQSLDALVDVEHGIWAYRALIAKDRNMIRAILMVCLRRRGQIENALAKVLDRAPPKKARHLIHTLHVAAAQILFLDIPDRAAVDLAVTAIAEDGRTSRFKSMTNAILRRLSREKVEILSHQNEAALAMPAWFFKRMKTAYGRDRAEAIAAIHLIEPPLDLTVKSNSDGWADRLGGFVLPTGSVRLARGAHVPKLEGYSDGEWWVQDVAATLPVKLMGDVKGLEVADLCAAPGGKTAQLIVAGASVTAVDRSEKRLQRLRENLNRLGLEANLIAADLLEWEPDKLFDAVLLDAPCSATGTIRRHPDVQWTKTSEEIAELAKLQFQMIVKAATLLRPGGRLVFANCSLDREEGEDIYAALLKSDLPLQPDAILPEEVPGLEQAITRQGTLRTLPVYLDHEDQGLAGMDGFFAARFRKAE